MLATLQAGIPALALGTAVTTLEIVLVVIFGLGFIGFGMYGSRASVIAKYANREIEMEEDAPAASPKAEAAPRAATPPAPAASRAPKRSAAR
jgi:hypothetical protein